MVVWSSGGSGTLRQLRGALRGARHCARAMISYRKALTMNALIGTRQLGIVAILVTFTTVSMLVIAVAQAEEGGRQRE